MDTSERQFSARAAVGDPPRLAPDVASATLGSAILLGVAGDSLIGQGPTGLGFPIWIALVAVAAVALVWRAGSVVPRETAFWLLTAVVCAAGVALRQSEVLQFFDIVAAIGALVLAAASATRAEPLVFASRLRDVAWAAAGAVAGALTGIFPLALREAPTLSTVPEARGQRWRVVRAVLLTAVVVLVFGALLRAADPIFASLVSLPSFRVDTLIRHLVLSAVFAALIGGAARSALLPAAPGEVSLPSPFFQLDRLEVSAALGALNILFAAFVLTQLGWFFGGEAFLRARTGLTAAEYARSGFFQLVWVVVLVVPLLIASRAMLAPDPALRRRHTALALPIVGLLGVMIVSAVLRMRLYVHYYGLSADRFYPLAFMAWLGVVLLWLTLTVLRDRPQLFPAGAAVSALVTLLTLNVIAPDRVVAAVNVARDRAATAPTTPLDVRYLAQLSGEAVDIAVNAVLTMSPTTPERERERCEAARTLVERWGPTSARVANMPDNAAWRLWNAGEASAIRAVRAHSGELYALARGCPRRARQLGSVGR